MKMIRMLPSGGLVMFSCVAALDLPMDAAG